MPKLKKKPLLMSRKKVKILLKLMNSLIKLLQLLALKLQVLKTKLRQLKLFLVKRVWKRRSRKPREPPKAKLLMPRLNMPILSWLNIRLTMRLVTRLN